MAGRKTTNNIISSKEYDMLSVIDNIRDSSKDQSSAIKKMMENSNKQEKVIAKEMKSVAETLKDNVVKKMIEDNSKQEKVMANLKNSAVKEAQTGKNSTMNPYITKDNIFKKDTEEFFDRGTKMFSGVSQIFKNSYEEIKSGINNFVGKIGGHVREILGPVAEAWDMAISAFKSTWSVISAPFKDIFKGGEDKKQTGLLSGISKKIAGYFRYKKKKDMVDLKTAARETDIKKSMWGKWLAIIFAIGAIIGAMARKILLPFELFGKAIWTAIKLLKGEKLFKGAFLKVKNVITGLGNRLLKWIKDLPKIGTILRNIGNWFRSLSSGIKEMPVVGKIVNFFSRIFGWFIKIGNLYGRFTGLTKLIEGVGKPFKLIGWIFGKIKSMGKLFGPVAKLVGKVFGAGFIAGFTKLFLPLQIIMSAIDFIKGFMSTEGDIIDKIKAGLMGVVEGFISFPVKLVGWITDWLLGLFGIKIEGGAGEALMNNIMTGVNTALDVILSPFKFIWTQIQKVINMFRNGETETGEKATIFDKILETAKIALGVMLYPFTILYTGIKKLVDWVGGKGTTDNIFDKIMNFLTSLPGQVHDWIIDHIPGAKWVEEGIKSLFEGVGGGDVSFLDQLIDFFSNLPSKISEWLKQSTIGKIVAKGLEMFKSSEKEQQQKLLAAKAEGMGYWKDDWGKNTLNVEAVKAGIKSGEINKEMLDAIEAQAGLDSESTKALQDLKEQATTHKGGHSLFVNVVNWDDLPASKSIKKIGSDDRIAQIEEEKRKNMEKNAIYKKNKEDMLSQERKSMVNAIKEGSMKTDRYQSEMNKQNNINSSMMNMIISGSTSKEIDIPEEVDNYLLGLAVMGVLS